MAQAIEYHFDERLKMSQGAAESSDIRDILLCAIYGSVDAYKSSEKDDRAGTDWWVVLCNGDELSVDCKVRSQDFAARGQDDLALETLSVVESNVIGWTLDKNKRTDYILWHWKDTKRWCVIPFRLLCGTFSKYKTDWCSMYKMARQKTPRDNGRFYHSECVFVPRNVVWRAIYADFSGMPKAVAQ